VASRGLVKGYAAAISLVTAGQGAGAACGPFTSAMFNRTRFTVVEAESTGGQDETGA
jgi:hypothetical protein